MKNTALLWIHSFTSKEVSDAGICKFSNTGTTVVGTVGISPHCNVTYRISFYFSNIGNTSTRQIGTVG